LKINFRILGTPEDKETYFSNLKISKVNYLTLDSKGKDLADLFPMLDSVGVDLMSKMLAIDPNKRISASRALEHKFFNDEIDIFGV
jgi:cyclin-dependent kinase 2